MHNRPFLVLLQAKHAFLLPLLDASVAIDSVSNLLYASPDGEEDPPHVRGEHLSKYRLLRIVLEGFLDVV